MSKLAIQWYDSQDVLVVRELEASVACDQVLRGFAQFTYPGPETDRALQQACELAAQRLSDDARNRRDAHRPDWLRSNSKLETIQLLGHVMRERNRE
jgi:hypothetical protein